MTDQLLPLSAIQSQHLFVVSGRQATWTMPADPQEELKLAQWKVIPVELSPLCLLGCLPSALCFLVLFIQSLNILWTHSYVNNVKTCQGWCVGSFKADFLKSLVQHVEMFSASGRMFLMQQINVVSLVFKDSNTFSLPARMYGCLVNGFPVGLSK